jgi:KEOPS complex subunit Pcc1
MITEAHAVLHFKLSSEKEAEIISRSIQPETETTTKHRSKVKVTRERDSIILVFESKDVTALRASINSYLSWLILLRGIYVFLEDQKRQSESEIHGE